MTTTTISTLDLLEAVNQAEVWQDTDGVANLYLRNVFGMETPYQQATDEIRAAEEAGLVTLVEGINGGRLWWLTGKGGRRLFRLRHPRLIDRLIAAFRR
jgi:hypothetical protein